MRSDVAGALELLERAIVRVLDGHPAAKSHELDGAYVDSVELLDRIKPWMFRGKDRDKLINAQNRLVDAYIFWEAAHMTDKTVTPEDAAEEAERAKFERLLVRNVRIESCIPERLLGDRDGDLDIEESDVSNRLTFTLGGGLDVTVVLDAHMTEQLAGGLHSAKHSMFLTLTELNRVRQLKREGRL